MAHSDSMCFSFHYVTRTYSLIANIPQYHYSSIVSQENLGNFSWVSGREQLMEIKNAGVDLVLLTKPMEGFALVDRTRRKRPCIFSDGGVFHLGFIFHRKLVSTEILTFSSRE